MINWILGGLIIGAAVFIIARNVNRMRKGESTCSSCSDCSSGACCSSKSGKGCSGGL